MLTSRMCSNTITCRCNMQKFMHAYDVPMHWCLHRYIYTHKPMLTYTNVHTYAQIHICAYAHILTHILTHTHPHIMQYFNPRQTNKGANHKNKMTIHIGTIFSITCSPYLKCQNFNTLHQFMEKM